jgi:hypothetical protein
MLSKESYSHFLSYAAKCRTQYIVSFSFNSAVAFAELLTAEYGVAESRLINCKE